MIKYIILICSTLLLVNAFHSTGLKGKFIHVTDFHIDPYYLEGASVESFCHRKEANATKIAGKFGALGSDCDSPKALVNGAFDFMKTKALDIDFVIYTGDSVRHGRDNITLRTRKDWLAGQKNIARRFSKSFSNVIPVLGNNDVEVHNSVRPYDDDFLKFKHIWVKYYHDLNFGFNFVRGGYYTQDILSNLRTINTNTMMFFKENILLKEDCDVVGSPGRRQLDWLKKSLEKARSQNVKVYIIAHVPPNNKKDKEYFKPNCYSEYYSILGAYSDVTLAHISGHFNYDQLTAILKNKKDGSYKRVAALGKNKEVLTKQELEDNQVVSVLFNGPSIIPRNNPAVRIYTFETEGKKYPIGTILDWEQYYVDLDEANKNGKLEFKLEYTASELFGVDHFDPSGLQSVFEAISLDKHVKEEYSNYRTVSRSKPEE